MFYESLNVQNRMCELCTFSQIRSQLLMQQYKPASIQMLRHQYDTPTFKTNALRLVSNEGRLKRIL